MFFLCYSLMCHKNPLEIFPYGARPLPTGKFGKLTPVPSGKSDPFRRGGIDFLWNHTILLRLTRLTIKHPSANMSTNSRRCWLSTDTPPTLDWRFTDTLPTHYWCYLHRLSVDLSTNLRLTGKHHSAKILVHTWQILDRLLVNILVESWHWV